jgi:hypothetical protein
MDAIAELERLTSGSTRLAQTTSTADPATGSVEYCATSTAQSACFSVKFDDESDDEQSYGDGNRIETANMDTVAELERLTSGSTRFTQTTSTADPATGSHEYGTIIACTPMVMVASDEHQPRPRTTIKGLALLSPGSASDNKGGSTRASIFPDATNHLFCNICHEAPSYMVAQRVDAAEHQRQVDQLEAVTKKLLNAAFAIVETPEPNPDEYLYSDPGTGPRFVLDSGDEDKNGSDIPAPSAPTTDVQAHL